MLTGQVFISRTGDMAVFPEGRSYVRAALDGVIRAGMAPVDMGYFAARDGQPADYCRERVRQCEVYVAVVGFRYGSVVPGEAVSYTELEFAEAGAAGLPRLVFLLDETAVAPTDADRGLVDGFRERLRRARLITAGFTTADGLELAVYQALTERVQAGGGRAGPAVRRRPAADLADGARDDGLERVTDRLAVAVRAQWEAAAAGRGLAEPDPVQVSWGRPSRTLAGSAASAASSRRFDPLPGLAPVSEAQLAAGRVRDLHAVYGGLGSGRLIIVGPPGSGKSGAAVLLILAALRHRARAPADDRAKIPVPVLVTAQDWDPRRQPVADWLAARLQDTYPLFRGAAGKAAAGTLITAGKIAVILDGLDEIAASLRPVALQALSQQASFRVVVLSRTAEMASAATRQGILQGAAAIELRPVSAAEAGRYLERVHLDPPPAGWADLTGHIRAYPASPLSSALNSPLSLTLVRDTYQAGDDARELLRFCGTLDGIPAGEAAEQITGHLLDRVLPVAYARRPGQPPPRYDLPTARAALARIAVCMNEVGTRDLEWWRIPAWLPRVSRAVGALRAGLLAAPFFVLLGVLSRHGLGARLVFGLKFGLFFGLLFAIQYAIAYSDTDRREHRDPPRRIRRPRLRNARPWGTLSGVFLYVLMFVLGSWLTGGLGQLGGNAGGLTPGLGQQFSGGIAAALADDPASASARSPVASWRDGVKLGLMTGLMTALMTALTVGLVTGLESGLKQGLSTGLNNGLRNGIVAAPVGIGLGLYVSVVWVVFLAEVRMAMKWRTPIRLMRFLDDARGRNVLRTVGPVYQFRHARLQDRLAGTRPAPRPAPGVPKQRKTRPAPQRNAASKPP